jgi:hypothetical protein
MAAPRFFFFFFNERIWFIASVGHLNLTSIRLGLWFSLFHFFFFFSVALFLEISGFTETELAFFFSKISNPITENLDLIFSFCEWVG